MVRRKHSRLVEDEDVRAARLLDAQAKAAELFAAIEPRAIIAPGVREVEASDAIRDLAAEMFGVDRHWHKRIVRAGPNTLQPYRQNPPDRVLGADDIAFCDFGPVFEHWEADFGRTYVLGQDPVKLRLRDALPVVFDAGRRFFEAHEDISGEQLYAHMVSLAADAGWTFGGSIAGHLVGQFPHEKISGDKIESYIAPGSDQPMRRRDANGQICHWILEVHLVDTARQIGGFYEELLDLGHAPAALPPGAGGLKTAPAVGPSGRRPARPGRARRSVR
jgi:Metallopeptidase family M24